MSNLTERERQALDCISTGLTIDQVADVLCISRSTAEKLLLSAKRKLHARTLAHAVSIAIRGGVLTAMMCLSVWSGADVQRLRTRTSRREWATVQQVVTIGKV